MWELDHKESWAPKNWCFWPVVLEKTHRVPWTARRSNQSILKEISPEWSLEGLMLKLKPILWPRDAKNWLIGKDPDAGKDWEWEAKGTTEGEMVGWHHWLDGHAFEQALGVGEGQGGLACCGPWGPKESERTQEQNNRGFIWPPWPSLSSSGQGQNCFDMSEHSYFHRCRDFQAVGGTGASAWGRHLWGKRHCMIRREKCPSVRSSL